MRAIKYCPECGTESLVIDSRPREGGGIYRRRYCPKCGTWKKWSTIEISFDDYREVEKLPKLRGQLVNDLRELEE